jgi:hypothetical protein
MIDRFILPPSWVGTNEVRSQVAGLRRRKGGTGKTGHSCILRPYPHHRHCGRAVWIDAVVLRSITISWNNIIIPGSRSYYGRDDKPDRWFTNDRGLPRMSCRTKRPQITQHQGGSESERGHYPHMLVSLLRLVTTEPENEHLIMIVPAARG